MPRPTWSASGPSASSPSVVNSPAFAVDLRGLRGDGVPDDQYERAWSSAYAHLTPVIHRVLSRHLGAESLADMQDVRDDLTAEVWDRARLGIRTFRGPAERFPHWLAGMARNVYREFVRGRVRRRAHALRAQQALGAGPVVQPPQTAALNRLAMNQLLTALGFPPEHREVVILHLEGYSNEAIAQVSATYQKPAVVRALVHRLLGRLRQAAQAGAIRQADLLPYLRQAHPSIPGRSGRTGALLLDRGQGAMGTDDVDREDAMGASAWQEPTDEELDALMVEGEADLDTLVPEPRDREREAREQARFMAMIRRTYPMCELGRRAEALFATTPADQFPGFRDLLVAAMAGGSVTADQVADAVEMPRERFTELLEGAVPATAFPVRWTVSLGRFLGLERDVFLELIGRDHRAWEAKEPDSDDADADQLRRLVVLTTVLAEMRQRWD